MNINFICILVVLMLLISLLFFLTWIKHSKEKELRYEIVEKNYKTSFYFVITPRGINKNLLRRVFSIISKHVSKEKILCLVRMMVNDKSFDDVTICGSFSIINEKHFIVTILEGMKNLKDKEKAYPLDHITHLIIKVYHKPVVKSISQASNQRMYSTIKALKARLILNLSRFMVFDIETIQIDKSFIPYAVGISSKRNTKIFYVTDYEGNDFISRSKLMMKHFITFLVNLPSDRTIFAHNLGNFDGNFLLKAFLESNIKVNLLIDDQNSFITISFRNSKGRNITFKDSLRILPSSLKELSKIYNVEYKKLDFDHDSVTIDKILTNSDFRTKQLEPYLKFDLLSLHEVLLKSSKLIAERYQVNLLSSYSTSSLAMKIFRTKFLKENIPILPRFYDEIIRKSYFGGIVNVYKPYGRNLYYYDVNSLYPYVMKMAMPGKYIRKTRLTTLNGFFGFVKARIKIPKNCKYPFAPYRSENGNLITPTGEWTSLYFSEELKDFIRRGYKVTPILGYEHEKINPFKDYVDHFYDLKKKTKGSERFMIKLLLNGLYGYFGRKPVQDIVECIHKKELNYISCRYNIINWIEFDNTDNIVVRRDILPSKDIMIKTNCYNDKDFLSLLKDLPKTSSNVAIASAITSYARVYLYSFVDQLKGELYYLDTDSIITDQPLPSHIIGDNIGQMKDELNGTIAEEGYFLASKLYGLKLSSHEIVKAKGLPKASLSFDDLHKLYEGTEIKLTTLRFYNNLDELKVNKNTIQISVKRDDTNLKHINVYDSTGKWISTKPIHISLFSNFFKRFLSF